MTDKVNWCTQHEAHSACINRLKSDVALAKETHADDVRDIYEEMRSKVSFAVFTMVMAGAFAFALILFGINQESIAIIKKDTEARSCENRARIEKTQELNISIDKRLSNIETALDIEARLKSKKVQGD